MWSYVWKNKNHSVMQKLMLLTILIVGLSSAAHAGHFHRSPHHHGHHHQRGHLTTPQEQKPQHKK
jgi:hypothetical protein